MCTGFYPDNINVCPGCKRDDEGYKMCVSESPFKDLGNGKYKCICGEIFYPTGEMLKIEQDS
jgi:hypothetical protein